MDEFSRIETKVYMSPVGIGIAKYGSASDSDGVLLARQVVFREFGYVLSVDHVRFDPFHPYLDRRLINCHPAVCQYVCVLYITYVYHVIGHHRVYSRPQTPPTKWERVW